MHSQFIEKIRCWLLLRNTGRAG